MQDVSLWVAFISGVVSFFAPCVLPLLPAYISYVTGVSLKELKSENGVEKYKRQIISSSVWYLLGFSSLFVALGSMAASFGSLFRQNSESIQFLGGGFIMLFALHFMGVVKIPFLSSGFHVKMPSWVSHVGKARAFVMGVVFGTAWTPCVGAILGVILTMAAASKTVMAGAGLLFVYSMGISIPFLILSFVVLRHPFVLKLLQRYSKRISMAGGVMLLVIGFLLMNNTLRIFGDAFTYNALNQWFFKMSYKFGF